MHAQRLAETTDTAIDDCWNRIGVRGDGSCVQLAKHIHCRNCPVYSAAASTLLDGALPADYRAYWTTHLARAKTAVDANLRSVVVFRIRGEWLALPSMVFDEAASMRAIHSLPHRRNGAMLGLANVRGELRACVSLRQLLGLHDAATVADARQASLERLLVVRYDGHKVAFPVDEVHGIHRFEPRELQERPTTISLSAATYTKAVLPWKRKFVGLLDEQLLFRAIDRSLASATAI